MTSTLFRASDRGGMETSHDGGATWHFTFRTREELEDMHGHKGSPPLTDEEYAIIVTPTGTGGYSMQAYDVIGYDRDGDVMKPSLEPMRGIGTQHGSDRAKVLDMAAQMAEIWHSKQTT